MIRSCSVHDFPFFCAALISGYTLLQIPLRIILRLIARYVQAKRWGDNRSVILLLSRFLAGFCSAWFSISLLNEAEPGKTSLSLAEGDPDRTLVRTEDIERSGQTSSGIVGRSIDLTLFASSRAVDTIVYGLWVRRRKSRILRNRWTAIDEIISRHTDALVFATSAGAVMWAWFYLPNRLPRAYRAWIKSAAQVDERLIEALRRVRHGQLIYGEDTGQAPLLQSKSALPCLVLRGAQQLPPGRHALVSLAFVAQAL